MTDAQRQAIATADFGLSQHGLPTYSELLAALERSSADDQPAPLFVNSTVMGSVETIEVSTVPGQLP